MYEYVFQLRQIQYSAHGSAYNVIKPLYPVSGIRREQSRGAISWMCRKDNLQMKRTTSTAIHSMCAFAHFRLSPLFGIHTMNESPLFRVVLAAVVSLIFYSWSWLYPRNWHNHPSNQRVIHIRISHSPIKVSNGDRIVFKFGHPCYRPLIGLKMISKAFLSLEWVI